MTTPRIEEIVEEFNRLEELCDEDSDQIVAMYRRNLRPFFTEAYQAGIDEAVEICWRYCGTDASDNLEDAIKQERERIKALQDNK